MLYSDKIVSIVFNHLANSHSDKLFSNKYFNWDDIIDKS